MIDDGKHWFLPKRYGYGAGLPVAWQGWVLIGLFVAGLVLAGALTMPQNPIVFAVVILILTVALGLIAAGKTRGGWRWRWGEKE